MIGLIGRTKTVLPYPVRIERDGKEWAVGSIVGI